ncbi:MAG: FG-GAP-like repeat-containing protein [Planctomycetota bacterium]
MLRSGFAPPILTALLLTGCTCDGGGATEPRRLDDPAIVRQRNLALALLEAERAEEAAAALDALIAKLPDEPTLHANRGLLELQLGDLAAARPHLDQAGRLAPDHPEIALLRAKLATFQGSDDEAASVLALAAAAHPRHLRVLWAWQEARARGSNAAGPSPAALLERMLGVAPANVLLRFAALRDRLAAGDRAGAAPHLEVIATIPVPSDGPAAGLRKQVQDAAEADDAATASRLVTTLENVLKPERVWQDAQTAVKGPLAIIADPIWDFARYELAEPEATAATGPLTFVADELSANPAALGVTAAASTTAGTALFAVRASAIQEWRVDAAGLQRLGETPLRPPLPAAVARVEVFDADSDRRLDVACALADGRVVILIRGATEGWQIVDAGLSAGAPATALLPWDPDMDGDLDLLVGRATAPTTVVRSLGGGAFDRVDLGPEVAAPLRDAAVADLDADGDLDLLAVDATTPRRGLENLRSARFAPRTGDDWTLGPADAITAADFDNDGDFDVVTLTQDGALALRRNDRGALGAPVPLPRIVPGDGGATLLRVSDLDRDGWLELIAVARGRPYVLGGSGAGLTVRAQAEVADATTVVATDAERDGDLDLLITRAAGAPLLLRQSGTGPNEWLDLTLEAILEGGQRNNAFGIGAIVEVKAGRLLQTRLVRTPVTHLGLGAAGPADVLRVTWPNGVPQNIIHPTSTQLITEKQALKGSCPYLLVRRADGALHFVTDLLWRSPLGMRINAQTVAPVGSTRDYVRVPGDVLQPRDGRYELAVSATLWETNFFDEIELWVVDHPEDVQVFVDERFVAPTIPPFEVHAVAADALRSPRAATDHRGTDVLDLVEAQDARHLGGFAKTRYQGIAEPHWVDIEFGPVAADQRVRLIASGWIRPTDTSINVAAGQAAGPAPSPLRVQVADGRGGWRDVIANAGFPAGKNKTIVLELTGLLADGEVLLRLRTDMEIYWDRLALAVGAPATTPEPVRLEPQQATLEFLGFPEIARRDADSPYLPDYSRLSHRPRWRDLQGWHTRFGDVRELLGETDDRYVIMNAGDVISLSFDAPPPPRAGWRRDFVFFSDGWVKDGDWNTVASKTTTPLPFHDMPSYPYPDDAAPATLRQDHPDWQDYHVRWIDGATYDQALRSGTR